MKKLLKFLIASIFITSFSNVSADFTIEKPAENETITEKIYKVEWKCDSELILYMEKEKKITNQNYIDCKNGKYEVNIDFSEINDWDKVFLVVWETTDDGVVRNIIYDSRVKNQKNKDLWSSPSKDALVLKNDPRVRIQWENFSSEEKNTSTSNNNSLEKEWINKNENNKENNENTKNKKEDIIETTLENGNKFSHIKSSCELPQNIRENLNKELKTNFKDISDSKFINEIKNLENLKIMVWTSKNTFENREITKAELLWIVLKWNCHDLYTKWDWRKKVLEVWLKEKIINSESFSKNISKKEAFEIILKWWKIKTPKKNSIEAMKYLWIFKENDKIEENKNLQRDEAANILVNILKKYK